MTNTRREPLPNGRANRRRGRPATTPEERENQLINMGYDLVEERMRAGTASAQETTFFLKMGSGRERIERRRLEKEVALLEAKIEDINTGRNILELYDDAIAAMRTYQGADEVYYDE